MKRSNDLTLKPLDTSQIVGIYGEQCIFPKRFGYLHPDAKEAFLAANLAANGMLVLSDMWRSAKASLARRYPNGRWLPKRSVKRPAFSAHNYGMAIDVAISATMANLQCTKKSLDDFLTHYGWCCHRLDHRRRSEEWHYNYLGTGFITPQGERSTAAAIERRIVSEYSNAWETMYPVVAMRYLRLPSIVDFQKRWRLKADGIIGPMTRRTMWFLWQEALFLRGLQ